MNQFVKKRSIAINANEDNNNRIIDYKMSRKHQINGLSQSSKYDNLKELYLGTGNSYKNLDNARNCRIKKLERPNSSY